jgi:hypothetical protein
VTASLSKTRHIVEIDAGLDLDPFDQVPDGGPMWLKRQTGLNYTVAI